MRSLILFPTAACDSHCLHCFYHEAVDRGGGSALTPRDTRRLALALGRIKDLSLSGGEPVLRPDLEELLAPLLRIGRPRTVTLPTGGLHAARVEKASRDILRNAPGARLTVALSLDGPPPVHDRIRGLPGAYARLRETHDRLAPLAQARILSLKLVTTLCSLNAGAFEGILAAATRDFPASVFHHFEIMRGSPRDASVVPPDPAWLAQIRPRIIDHWKHYPKFYGGGIANRLALAAKTRLFDLAVDHLCGGRQSPPCRVYKTHLVVSENGDVFFCELTAPIGNLRRDEWPVILQSAKAAQRKGEILTGCSCAHSCFTPSNLARSPREILRVAALAMKNS